MAATKEAIISEIKRTAINNSGTPLGQVTFERETGISTASWRGKYWRNWGDAVSEAGFAANTKNEAHETAFLVASLANLTRKNRRFPTYADTRLARESDKSFPAHQALTRLGAFADRVELVRQYAIEHPEFNEILAVLPEAQVSDDKASAEATATVDGFVYMGLLKIGREKRYKMGKTNLVERRQDQISVQLPENLDLVHAVKTDDPAGIENYWHKRFAAKRTKGEWFSLSHEDVKAFKRRKTFM
jgi:Meiotically up-regulated gene 113